jgi:hypothetical protein
MGFSKHSDECKLSIKSANLFNEITTAEAWPKG